MSARPSFDSGFSTEEMTALFSPESIVGALLRFEGELAMALADVGLAPSDEAEEVAAACRSGVSDPEALLESTWETGTPIIALREAVGAGKWFHHGATTQDAVDTAQMLLARSGLELLGERLVAIASRLRELTESHRDQPHMGRTFLQIARPVTFGFRTATWLDAVIDHVIELRARRGSLAVQLGGPVGMGHAEDEGGRAVLESLARRLGLRAPDISWHTNRTLVISLVQSVERVARTMAKIGTDIAILSSSSVAEISVRTGRSSSMPEKQNPIDSVRAIAAASACAGAATMLSTAPPHQLDRSVGGWHVEWLAVPLALETADAATEAIGIALDSLEVDAAAMGSLAESTEIGAGVDRVLERYAEVIAN